MENILSPLINLPLWVYLVFAVVLAVALYIVFRTQGIILPSAMKWSPLLEYVTLAVLISGAVFAYFDLRESRTQNIKQLVLQRDSLTESKSQNTKQGKQFSDQLALQREIFESSFRFKLLENLYESRCPKDLSNIPRNRLCKDALLAFIALERKNLRSKYKLDKDPCKWNLPMKFQPNLYRVVINDIDLEDFDPNDVDANLCSVNFRDAKFKDVFLENIKFDHANLDGTVFINTRMGKPSFSFKGTNITTTNFENAGNMDNVGQTKIDEACDDGKFRPKFPKDAQGNPKYKPPENRCKYIQPPPK